MKHDLKDITFVIPFFLDSKERMENLYCIQRYLQVNFDTNVLFVQEYISEEEKLDISHIYFKRHLDVFYRTKVINAGIRCVTTPFFCIYDADTIFKVNSYLQAAQLIRSSADVVYPYDGRFIDIQRSYIKDGVIKEATSFATESVGGAVFLNTQDYIKAGLENENIIGWGPEDAERYARLKTFGSKIERVEGKCWHITHPRGINSSPSNPHTSHNNAEFYKVMGMDKKELQEYIKSWPWAKQ